MRQLFTLVAMVVMAIGASAQNEKLIFEKDWSGVEYSEWVTFETVPDWMYEATAEGLAITHPSVTDQIWQVRVISGGDNNFSLEGGHDYVVRLTMKVPSDGNLFIQLGAMYSSWYDGCSVKASDDWQVIDIENQSFYSDIPNAHVLLGLGEMVGTTVLKKVQVYERLKGSETTIKAAKAVEADDAAYNLAGQKVSPSHKGIVIKHGLKYNTK